MLVQDLHLSNIHDTTMWCLTSALTIACDSPISSRSNERTFRLDLHLRFFAMSLSVSPFQEQLASITSIADVRDYAEVASTLWTLLGVVQFLFDDWLELRICHVSAVSRTACAYSHRARWWRYVRAKVERLGVLRSL